MAQTPKSFTAARPQPSSDTESIFGGDYPEVNPGDDLVESELRAQEEALFVRDVMAKHYAAKSGSELWRYHAKRAFNYYENDQRPPEIRDDDDAFFLILNLIRNRTDTKVGILTSAKPRAEMIARGMEDEDVSAAFRDIVEFSAGIKTTDLDAKVVDAVGDQVKVGLGILEEGIDHEEEQATRHGPMSGELSLEYRSPMDVYLDPSNRSPSLDGRRGINFLTIEEEVPHEELEMTYPAKAYRIQGVDRRQGGGALRGRMTAYAKDFAKDISRDDGDDTAKEREYAEDTKTVITIWYKKRIAEHKVWGRDPEDGSWEPAVDEDAEAVSVDDIADDDENYFVETKIRREWWTAGVTGDVLLYNYRSPYKHRSHPFVFFCGALHHDEATPYGEIHRLLDAQDMFNKINSLVIDNASRSNNTGWMVEEGALTEGALQDLEDRGSEPGFILKARPDAISTGSVKRLEPGQLSDALYRLQGDVRVLFDELSSLYQTQRGGMPYETSGKAIIALQQAGDTALVGLQRNIESAVTEWGRKRLSNIQQFYTVEKAWRISDKMKDVSYHYVTQMGWNQGQGQNSLELWKLEDGNPKSGALPEAKMLLKDFEATKYDIKITMGTGHERSREQKLEDAKLVFEVTGGVPSAVRHVLNEMEVPEKREMLQEMMEQNQVQSMMQQMEQTGVSPEILSSLTQMMGDPTMGQILQVLLSQPELLMKAVSESPTFMQVAQQMPLQEGPPKGGLPAQQPRIAA